MPHSETEKLNNSQCSVQRPRQKSNLIVSIATIPSRIGKLRPTLESLLHGNLVPDKILVVHPEFCKWESSNYEIPEFLRDPAFCKGIIENYVCSTDWGPGTKLLGALEFIDAECILVIADDDIIYHKDFLKGLVKSQISDEKSSFSYYTYRAGGLRIGQGCDGFSFWSPNLSGAKEFVDKYVTGTPLLYHDDLWISFFLFSKNIVIRQTPLPTGQKLIYEQVLPNNVLSSEISGTLARDNIFKEALPRLAKSVNISQTMKLQLCIFGATDKVKMKCRNAFIRAISLKKKYHDF